MRPNFAVFLVGLIVSFVPLVRLAQLWFTPDGRALLVSLVDVPPGGHVSVPGALRKPIVAFSVLNIPAVIVAGATEAMLAKMPAATRAVAMFYAAAITAIAWWYVLAAAASRLTRPRKT